MGIIGGLDVFFKDQIMYEIACEPNGKCNVDQRSFKAYLSRNMAAAVKLAPYTADILNPMIQASARAAAQQCSGTAGPYGARGNICGLKWTAGAQYDGAFGVGEQMSALEIIQANLGPEVAGPLTNATGGTSKGDASAGSGRSSDPGAPTNVTMADKAGAGILTTIVLVSILYFAYFMVT
jgi:mannan endo-1,6-alpha-mannosidase